MDHSRSSDLAAVIIAEDSGSHFNGRGTRGASFQILLEARKTLEIGNG